MRKAMLLLFLFVSLLLTPLKTSAFYQPEYQNRATTNFLDGVCPKPGFLFQIFYSNFRSVRLKDKNGDSLPGDFKLSVNTNLYNFVYISHKKLFGGLTGLELMIPYIKGHLTTDSPGGVMRGDDDGISDIFLGSFIQWKKTDCRFPIYYRLLGGVVFPTGGYSHTELFNVGYNLYTIHFNQASTIFFTPKLTVSWRLNYNFHTENHEYGLAKDDLKPGQLFGVNFTSCYEVKKGVRLGLVGNYWQQTTDDKINGQYLNVGKERALGLGPGIILNRNNIYLMVHCLFDTLVKCRPEGNTIQGRFMWFF